MASSDQDYHFALEEGLQWWITNSADPSWEELVSAIENCGDKDIAVIMRKELDIRNEDTFTPSELFRTHSADLSGIITPILTSVTNVLYAKELITFDTKTNISSITGEDDYKKSSKLVDVLQRDLKAHRDPYQYLVKFCNVLRTQQHQRLREITTFILQQLGENTDDEVSPNCSLDPSVQRYCDIMLERYKNQFIVPTDWPPPVGQDFFGRLALLQTQDRHATPQTILQKQWCMLRGFVDMVPYFTHDKQIDIQDILKPCDSGQSLRVIVDGPPGIGKTTLCHKLLNMWAKGELTHGQYNLVLYCPLRNDKVAQASSLADLSVYQSPTVKKVADWITITEGEGLLIIFDGWDELNTDLRQSSLAARIIRKDILAKCSVIVTSRSYASYSLFEVSSINRHVEVMGFSEEEIMRVIRGKLEEEPAKCLIENLVVRDDIMSLCYVPLICSIVILIFCKSEDGQLPTTLTELYEKFILQTIKRHMKINNVQDVQLKQLHNLNHIPSVMDECFQEICKFAYMNLKENNPRMTFSLDQLYQSLNQSVKENYLGLMATFTMYDEESYQFLHLSIQEFLAAWWIVKSEKTEQVFAEFFDNDHFRMCLRFVAGLTHLEHDSYQQYFNKELDLQCLRSPLFGFEVCYHSNFNQTYVRPHGIPILSYDLDVLLLHLLYESQNTTLCHTLAQSMKNQSLCLHRVDFTLTLFDLLCLSFFLNNSNVAWNYLDLEKRNGQEIQLLASTLTNHNQCKRLEVEVTLPLYHKVDIITSFHNLQESFITLVSHEALELDVYQMAVVLLVLIKQHLSILHFTIDVGLILPCDYVIQESESERILSEIEEGLQTNATLYELNVNMQFEPGDYYELVDFAYIANSVIKGVARNKSIKTFSFACLTQWPLPGWEAIPDEHNPLKSNTIKHLLRDNHILRALKLNIDNHLMPSLDIVEVNAPLTALEIKGFHQHQLKALCSKGVYSLILHQLYPLPLLFQCHPNLQQLELSLDTAESVIELFTILQNNTTVKALRVKILKTNPIFDRMGPSLQKMLTLNQTIDCLEIDSIEFDTVPNFTSYLSFLTTGLSHNTSLKELSIPIPLSSTNFEQLAVLFKVISHKNKLTELKLDFTLAQSCDSFVPSHCIERRQKVTQLLHEQGLPLITKVLESHATMRLLHLQCYDTLSFNDWLEQSQDFFESLKLYPSLEYIGIAYTTSRLSCIGNSKVTPSSKHLSTFHGLIKI